MAKVTLQLPEVFAFSTEIRLLRGHINAGNHLGNDALIGLLNEVRSRLLASCGECEGRREDGLVIVNADLVVRYVSEGHYGETLRFDVAFADFHRCGFDIVYRVSDAASGRLVAEAKTAHLLMSPALGRAVDLPGALLSALKAQ